MTIHEQERHTSLYFIHVVNCLTVIFIHKSLFNRKNPHYFLLHYARSIDVVYCVWYLSPLRGSNTTHGASMCCEKIDNTPQPSDSPSVWDKMGLSPSLLKHKTSSLIFITSSRLICASEDIRGGKSFIIIAYKVGLLSNAVFFLHCI